MHPMKRGPSSQKSPAAKRPRLSQAQSQAVQREVTRQLNKRQDYKICILEVASANIDFSGTVYDLLANLARGDNAKNNFEGAHIQAKGIHIRGELACGDVSNAIRIIVFQWMDDTPPTAATILDNGGILGTVDAPYATRNWSNRPLYKILRDDLCVLQANNGITGGNGFVKIIDYYIKTKKISKTFYAATTVAVQKGGLYLLALSDSGAVTHPQIIFTSEIVFTDE